jgi:hypothetical protein
MEEIKEVASEMPVEKSDAPKTVTIEEYQREQERAERILKESKSYKERLRALESEREIEAQKKLEDKEDWKSLLEESNKKITNYEQKLQNQTVKIIDQNIDFELAKNNANPRYIKFLRGEISWTEENIDTENLRVMDISTQLDSLKENFPDMFSTKPPKMNTTMPTGKPDTQLPPEKMSSKEKFRAVAKRLINE